MKIIEIPALVVGTGAAGYQAASQLKKGGKQVAIVTEGINMGTSRNTGSDKQTYYKLGLGGDSTDSVRLLAEDLFAGGAVDGDNALCEAALSARCFLHLCELGVPFPTNRYGEFVGYKTDHDPHARATSAGPLTSKFVTQALENQAKNLNIPIYDNIYAVQILKDVGLEDRMGNFPSQLSGGEQQRVAIARALAKNPKLLLCDEPTGALDYNTGKSILKLLQDTGRKTGMTVVLITHNTAITPMADRVIKVRSGTVVSVTKNEQPQDISEIEW